MIQFSKEAVDKVHYFLTHAKQTEMVLRIEIEDVQASELTYNFKLEPQEQGGPKDMTMPMHGFLTRMDSKTAIKLANQVVDWQEKDGKAGFAIKNSHNAYDPNENQGDSTFEQIISVLKTIYDPEIPVNIYDMGLIYDIDIEDDTKVKIQMTLTAPNCPAAEVLPGEVEEKILSIERIEKVDLELTWEPAWTPDLMTEEARLDLGM